MWFNQSASLGCACHYDKLQHALASESHFSSMGPAWKVTMTLVWASYDTSEYADLNHFCMLTWESRIRYIIYVWFGLGMFGAAKAELSEDNDVQITSILILCLSAGWSTRWCIKFNLWHNRSLIKKVRLPVLETWPIWDGSSSRHTTEKSADTKEA